MNTYITKFAILVGAVMLGAGVLDAAPEKGSRAEKVKQNWSFTPDPNLPDVLILGDSISIGYTLEVRALLKAKANVYRPLSADGSRAENCSGTIKGVERDGQVDGDPTWRGNGGSIGRGGS